MNKKYRIKLDFTVECPEDATIVVDVPLDHKANTATYQVKDKQDAKGKYRIQELPK